MTRDLVGDAPSQLPYYGLMREKIGGRDVVISRTGFSGENGYEIYLLDATRYAEDLWNAVLAGLFNEVVTKQVSARVISVGSGSV